MSWKLTMGPNVCMVSRHKFEHIFFFLMNAFNSTTCLLLRWIDLSERNIRFLLLCPIVLLFVLVIRLEHTSQCRAGGGEVLDRWGGHLYGCTKVLYCTVLYNNVLQCIVQYCTVLYCTILYYNVHSI